MDTESERVYDRMALHRLRHQHPEWGLEQLAEALGRSKRWVSKWLRRFANAPEQHYTMYLSQSRAPKRHPRQTPEEVKAVICELRESLSEKYHRPAGASLIRHYLQKHEIALDGKFFVPQSSRTITQILHERGYIPPRRKRQHLPLPLGAPMEEWEMDFCEIRLEDGKFEFFLVVDRGTSRVVYLEGCPGYRSDSALQAVFRLFLMNGLPKRLRLDRDPRFVWSWSADGFPAPLMRMLSALAVEAVICPPRRPDKKPYVERCIRTFKHEWLDRFSLDTLADCYEALRAFPHYHNRQRIHLGRTCKGRTPDEAFPILPELPQLPEIVQPTSWLLAQHGRVFRRRIRASGSIQIDKHTYYLDTKLAKHPVLVHLDANERCFRVLVDGKPFPKLLPIKELLADPLPIQDYLEHLQREATSIARYREMRWMQSGDAA